MDSSTGLNINATMFVPLNRSTINPPNPLVTQRILQNWISARGRKFPRVNNNASAREARLVFDRQFGVDSNSLQAWQDLCFFCGKKPFEMPTTIKGCKQWLMGVYVNVFDLVHAVRMYQVVEPRFDNAHELEIYSRQTGKICPASAAHGNEIFRFLLKRWF